MLPQFERMCEEERTYSVAFDPLLSLDFYIISSLNVGRATATRKEELGMNKKEATLSSALPVVDLSPYVKQKDYSFDEASCTTLTNALRDYGAILVRDPRVSPNDADKFINQMEQYFAQPDEEKLKDVRADKGYQIGATPAGIERARDNTEEIEKLKNGEKPEGTLKQNAGFRKGDPKWRFFWRVGEDGPAKDEQVVPENFDSWAEVMDEWGLKLIASLKLVVLMLEKGLGMKEGLLWEKFKGGPHLLAPTGCDLTKYGNKESIGVAMARFHYDLNALTIHGKSRYPGLYIWTKSGKRLKCKVPVGCLLVQAGVQIEHLTGGTIRRGFHEVVVREDTVAAAMRAEEKNAILWRISSTLFGHIRSEASLAPLLAGADSKKYPDIKAKDQVAAELKAINLTT
eukprot:Plantae.Rhodophyta-Hildenbrandia_rubra.ctg3386.p1 GENE.Plantae.Rhodophyta-Hildenbrandia_rubra.ctg3386~~Plantae.Rhodophyta-Hildenbrandia_rubra.ctg3386.p1  ORF type:complete len:400 (-),score=83.74 Plantae.Rhodophyta-Hildenbrandia_rubra.ctg3386:271-1470(-)